MRPFAVTLASKQLHCLGTVAKSAGTATVGVQTSDLWCHVRDGDPGDSDPAFSNASLEVKSWLPCSFGDVLPSPDSCLFGGLRTDLLPLFCPLFGSTSSDARGLPSLLNGCSAGLVPNTSPATKATTTATLAMIATVGPAVQTLPQWSCAFRMPHPGGQTPPVLQSGHRTFGSSEICCTPRPAQATSPGGAGAREATCANAASGSTALAQSKTSARHPGLYATIRFVPHRVSLPQPRTHIATKQLCPGMGA